MGLLDDAIREHLELKRRHGADPSEVDRLEHEALGPVRREPLERANSDVETDEHAAAPERPSELSETEYEEYYEEDYYDEAEGGDREERLGDDFDRPGSRASRTESPPASADRATTEPPPAHDTERGIRRWRRSHRGAVPLEDAPPTQAEPPRGMGPGDETVEYRAEDSLDRPTPEDEADVLEETPEFLQDAPEHDRLWFEQRPPRDFDFDG